MRLPRDNFKLGVGIGLVVPALVFYLLYKFRFGTVPFSDFLTQMQSEKRLLTFFVAWCLVSNIAVFTLFINTDRYSTGKGIFLMTVLWGLGFMGLRYFT